jgi:RNA polymerase sigma-70 factor (family 1)
MPSKISHDNEFDLLSDFKSGDEHSLKIMYDLHYHALWRFANGVIGDDEQAKDFVAESFIKTWEKREEFKNLTAIKNFLFIIVRNKCYSYISSIKRRRKSAKEILFMHNENDNCFLNEQIRAELLNHSLMESEKMPAQMKKIFRMIYVDGLSQQETADKLGLSVFTVRTQKFNAIKKLKTALEKKGLLEIFF